VILYVGLGMVAVGLVITFVGLGDKGFKTVELRLVGPSLVGCGMFFTVLRVLFCTMPAGCSSCKGCCNKKDSSEKMIKVEKLMEEKLRSNLNTKVTRNGLLRPIRNTVTKDRRPQGPDDEEHHQPDVITDSEEEESMQAVIRTRRQLKHEQQANKKGCDGSTKNENEDNLSDSFSSTFSLQDLGQLHVLGSPQLGGSTKNIRMGEVIMNANKL